jgi:NAD(P)-dependent dehydrogenase (short-subunit alcohol dehydrogenase family)
VNQDFLKSKIHVWFREYGKQELWRERKTTKILITGAFGNIGKAVISEAHRRHHKITVFEIDNKKTRKVARKYQEIIRVVFGDIRDFEAVKKAVQESERVIHLAAFIPPLSWELAKMSPYADRAGELPAEEQVGAVATFG